MYLTVRKYRKVEGDREQMVKTVNSGFVPLISKIKGFVDYYCIFADDGSLLSVSVYEDKSGADEALRAAGKWVEQNMSKQLPDKPEVISGEVFALRHAEKQKAA
jgi:hypothetical protein